MAQRTGDSDTYLPNQVTSRIPIIAAPYSRAAKAPPESSDTPKIEYMNAGTRMIGTPSTRHTTALSVISVWNIMLRLFLLRCVRVHYGRLPYQGAADGRASKA